MPGATEEIVARVEKNVADRVREAVAAGEYDTPDEVVSDALGLWQAQRLLGTQNAGLLKRLYDEGKASGIAGPLDMNRLFESAMRRVREGKVD